MAIRGLCPYLNFNGTAEKAIRLYEQALGARVESLMRFGDVAGMKVAPEHRDRVIHAVLHVGGGVVMLSDVPPGMAAAEQSNVHVALQLDEVADLARKFDALAAGGRVTMPLQDTFWGARFGMLTDAYGINWMFNCEPKKS